MFYFYDTWSFSKEKPSEEIRDLKATSHERSHKTTINDSNFAVRTKNSLSNAPNILNKNKKKVKSSKEKSLGDHFKFKLKMLQLRWNNNIIQLCAIISALLRRSSVRVEAEEYHFLEPCPPSMMHLHLTDLATSDISWKMMTAFRPEQVKDENVFSRSRHQQVNVHCDLISPLGLCRCRDCIEAAAPRSKRKLIPGEIFSGEFCIPAPPHFELQSDQAAECE